MLRRVCEHMNIVGLHGFFSRELSPWRPNADYFARSLVHRFTGPGDFFVEFSRNCHAAFTPFQQHDDLLVELICYITNRINKFNLISIIDMN